MAWINLVQDRDQWRLLVNTAINLRVQSNIENFLSGGTTGGCSRTQLHEVTSLDILDPRIFLLVHPPNE
jgi:hypothetical protein